MAIKTIGFVGTAKNTGKTTASSLFLRGLVQRGFKVGITSIGFDGEEIDNITLLPKPRYFLQKGVLVLTAQECFKASRASLRIISKTGFFTPLGQILLLQVQEEGHVLLAGPNREQDLKELLSFLPEELDYLLLDGALNRIAPLSQAHGIVLSTGASRERNLERLTEEMRAVEGIMKLQEYREHHFETLPRWVASLNRSGSFHIMVKKASLFNSEDILKNAAILQESQLVWIPGVLSQASLQQLMKILPQDSILLFSDPLKLILAGDVTRTYDSLQQLARIGIRSLVSREIHLLAITVNPFYPQYNPVEGGYEGASIDADLLKKKVGSGALVPVYDVVKDGPLFVEGLLAVTSGGKGA